MKLFLILLALLALATPVDAAVTFDNATKSTELSVGHTVGAGSNTYALACISTRSDPNNVTAVSYGASAMTQIAEVANSGQRAELWGIINPPTGAQTVTATSPGSDEANILVLTFFGVDQVTPLGTTLTATSESGAVTISLTPTVAAGGLALDCLGKGGADTLVATAPQTDRANQTNSDSGAASSTNSGTGSVAMSWTWSVSHYYAYIATPINAATGVATHTHKPIVMQ